MVHPDLPVQIQIAEKNLEVFYPKGIIQFNDLQSLILETRRLRSGKVKDLQEVT